jgi:hypothetical protein
MAFYTPSWVPKLPIDSPDSISISEFVFNEEFAGWRAGWKVNEDNEWDEVVGVFSSQLCTANSSIFLATASLLL